MRIALATDATGADSLAERHALAMAARAGTPLVKIHVEAGDDVVDDVLERLRETNATLVVLGTHARHGLPALLHESVAEAIARNLDVPALIIPNHSRGFLAENGTHSLRRVLVPALDPLDARRATAAARSLLDLVGAPEVPIEVSDRPLAELLEIRDASLIVMATHGHDSLDDVLRGSHTERAVRDGGCAVLCVPR